MRMHDQHYNFLPFTEVELGKIIQKYNWKRAGYVVMTKIYWSMKSDERGLSRKHIIESVKASLQRLQLPYVDIVIIYKADPMCPMEGTYVCNSQYCHNFQWLRVCLLGTLSVH